MGLVFLLGLHSLLNYHHFSTLVSTEGEARTGSDVDGGAEESIRYLVEDERKQGVEKGQGLDLVLEEEQELQRWHHGGGLVASSQELWRLHNPNRPGTQPGDSGAERQRADSARI